jgi:predicted nicotinamide N-methyase
MGREQSFCFAADCESVTCTTRGAKKYAGCGDDPVSLLTLSSDNGSEEITIKLRHNAHGQAHTGGHVWSSSRHLAQWLCAHRAVLPGRGILELGAGLGLPSTIAAKLGAKVTSTDNLSQIVEYLQINSELNACEITARKADFTRHSDIQRVLAEGTTFDLVLFSDCVYDGEMGASLPYALAELLLANTTAVAVGVFPSQIRAGVPQFWEHASKLLRWTPHPLGGAAQDPRTGTLYAFRTSPGANAVLAANANWLESLDEVEECELAPLFEDDDSNGRVEHEHAS